MDSDLLNREMNWISQPNDISTLIQKSVIKQLCILIQKLNLHAQRAQKPHFKCPCLN